MLCELVYADTFWSVISSEDLLVIDTCHFEIINDSGHLHRIVIGCDIVSEVAVIGVFLHVVDGWRVNCKYTHLNRVCIYIIACVICHAIHALGCPWRKVELKRFHISKVDPFGISCCRFYIIICIIHFCGKWEPHLFIFHVFRETWHIRVTFLLEVGIPVEVHVICIIKDKLCCSGLVDKLCLSLSHHWDRCHNRTVYHDRLILLVFCHDSRDWQFIIFKCHGTHFCTASGCETVIRCLQCRVIISVICFFRDRHNRASGHFIVCRVLIHFHICIFHKCKINAVLI